MKPIPNYPGYFATPSGDIYSSIKRANQPIPKTPKLIKKWEAHGYWKVSTIHRDEYVHRLVLATFKGKQPEGNQCRHLNGNRKDNRVENLEWGTPRENQADRKITGTDNRGEKHPQHKLTKEQVLEIRRLGAEGNRKRRKIDHGGNYAEIARKFNVSTTAICSVVLKKTWKWLT